MFYTSITNRQVIIISGLYRVDVLSGSSGLSSQLYHKVQKNVLLGNFVMSEKHYQGIDGINCILYAFKQFGDVVRIV